MYLWGLDYIYGVKTQEGTIDSWLPRGLCRPYTDHQYFDYVPVPGTWYNTNTQAWAWYPHSVRDLVKNN